MEQAGEYRVSAVRGDVWEALNDPEILGACITGCEGVTRIDDEHFDVKVKAKIGPVSATFDAALELSDLDPPASYVIQGNVKGGAAGFAKGSAKVALAEDGAETVLTYQVHANVGGKLAQVGSRLVDGAARKMADEFFAAFSERMSAPAGEEQIASALPEDGTAASEEAEFESSGQRKIWIIAFVVLALAVILAI